MALGGKRRPVCLSRFNAWGEWPPESGTEGAPGLSYCSLPMVGVDTFRTTRSGRGDDWCTTALPLETPPGPHAALTRGATVTVALFGQGQGFGRTRGVCRSAQRHVHAAFPRVPSREQYNRHVRQQHPGSVGVCTPPLAVAGVDGRGGLRVSED